MRSTLPGQFHNVLGNKGSLTPSHMDRSLYGRDIAPDCKAEELAESIIIWLEGILMCIIHTDVIQQMSDLLLEGIDLLSS